MTSLQKALQALEVAKKQELENGTKPKYINMGVRGSDITGIKRW